MPYNGREERDADVTTGGHNAPGGAFGGGTGAHGVSIGAGPRGANLHETSPITANANDRVNDYEDRDNSFIDDVGNFLAGTMGLHEINPVKSNVAALQDNSVPNPHADWGWDPASTIGSLAGMAVGMPVGPGMIADKVSALFGRPLEVNLGPAVFGAFGDQPTAPAPAATMASSPTTQTSAMPGMPELNRLAETNPQLHAQVAPYLASRPGFKALSMTPQYQAGGAFT